MEEMSQEGRESLLVANGRISLWLTVNMVVALSWCGFDAANINIIKNKIKVYMHPAVKNKCNTLVELCNLNNFSFWPFYVL